MKIQLKITYYILLQSYVPPTYVYAYVLHCIPYVLYIGTNVHTFKTKKIVFYPILRVYTDSCAVTTNIHVSFFQ